MQVANLHLRGEKEATGCKPVLRLKRLANRGELRRCVALVPLSDLVGLVPVTGDRELHAATKVVGLRHFTRSLNTFRTFATLGAAAA